MFKKNEIWEQSLDYFKDIFIMQSKITRGQQT